MGDLSKIFKDKEIKNEDDIFPNNYNKAYGMFMEESTENDNSKEDIGELIDILREED